ncbi:spermidine/putrescine ABC transporter permease [Allostella sp. ATCC 35155]|nr:spermidine/putrescine ABC transporter permease [Stella sp. ATCC 35155]
MNGLAARYGWPLAAICLALVAAWLALLILLPQLMMFEFSLRPNLLPRQLGGPEDVRSLANYARLFGNPIHLGIFLQTIWASSLVTVVVLAVCYPIAFYLAQVARGRQAALLFVALVVPFWVNEILRAFAWLILLARNGLVNRLLIDAGLIAEPLPLLGGTGSVLLGMVYAYVLFMVFPLYNAIESLERQQIEAARDLGAPWWRIHWRVVLPHAKPGIAVGCIMTFMLAAGSYAVPMLLGGVRSRWFTEVIYTWFFEGANWNQGAAYAFVLLLLCILFIFAMMRIFRVRVSDIGR